MSDGYIDTDNQQRPRSFLRQVRETFTGINRQRQTVKARTNSPVYTLVNKNLTSLDDIDIGNMQTKSHTKKSTPISFTHHLSLLNQVKSRFNKSRRLQTSLDSDDYAHSSLPSVILSPESKSTNTFVADSKMSERKLQPSQALINTMLVNGDNQVNSRQDSVDMSLSYYDDDDDDDAVPELFQSPKSNRTTNSKMSNQQTRNLLTKSPSLTSIATNISLPKNPFETIYFVELCVDRGKDLSIKDLNGTSDPYVKVYYGTEEKYVTNTVYKNLNPIWNEKVSFFVNDLSVPVYLYMYDYDRIGRDESMGSTKIDLNKLNVGESSNMTLELKNEKRTDGKTGLLIININVTQKTSEFRDEVLRTLSKQSNGKSSLVGRAGGINSSLLTRRTIDVFIIEGRNLTVAGSASKILNPYVRLKFGANKKYRTQTVKSTVNPKWHQSFIYEIVINELPSLELTVIDDSGGSGDFIGRGICNLSDLDEERTHRLLLDLDDNAGVIELFVTISGIAPAQELSNEAETLSTTSMDILPSRITDEEIEHYSLLSSLRSMKSIRDVGLVEVKSNFKDLTCSLGINICLVYQARDLSAKDINGKSDPFCVIEVDSTRLRTHTIYKTLDPVWNKSFIIPVQDIHSILELTVYDEDMNKTTEFIGKVSIPLLAIRNGEKKWMTLKDRKCILPVKGILEIEATLVYSNLRAIVRTFNPRQFRYYQQDGKFRLTVFKQHINRVRNSLRTVVNAVKFINYCFQWENPVLSFCTFIASLVIVWNFELYMLPCVLLLIFAWNAIVEYRRGTLGKPFATLGDETVSSVIQPMVIDEDTLDTDLNTKEQKKSLLSVIHGIQDTVLEVQGYIDDVASTLERIKNVFNFTVPWLSFLAIIVLALVSIILYYIPFRYLVLAFITNKFTKRFRKPKGYIDNNELADFLSRLPSDPELLQYRELKVLSRTPTPKKNKRPLTSNR
ncbi:unnamed protein product [Adineta ricciae]|uniref:C2 domain-containing protein n=1 Tax=Adineta ricciae TaxID=249248 RepID=A0A815P9Q7_ADIRI|nr:unnamed protein product [Adineta ricciae]